MAARNDLEEDVEHLLVEVPLEPEEGGRSMVPPRRPWLVAVALLVLGAVAVGWGRAGTSMSGADDVELDLEAEPDDLEGFWVDFDRPGDEANPMKEVDAEKLDATLHDEANKRFPSLPNMTPLLYPATMQAHDAAIASKLEPLTRDSKIVLPGGPTIPYWQTLQYANRHFRMYITRILQEKIPMPDKDVEALWLINSIQRKLLVTDCFKDRLLSLDFPSTFNGFKGNAHRGKPFSGQLFYDHLDADRRGSWVKLGNLKKVSAIAHGDGITFNDATPFSERKRGSAAGLLAHEQAHCMGYSHADKAPYRIQGVLVHCFKKFAYKYTTYDLAKTPDFTVL